MIAKGSAEVEVEAIDSRVSAILKVPEKEQKPNVTEKSTDSLSAKQSTESWNSSVGELHSELMKARYNAAKHFMKQNYTEGALTMDEAIAAVKKLEAEGDQALFDFYLENTGGNLAKHFKGETDDSIKKLLIQILPGVVPAAVVGAGMNAGESGVPENRYGGNIKNLSKFIRK